MVGIVYGKSGSGKSEWVFARASEAARSSRVYLFVPDREAVAAEGRVAELPFAGNVEVVTFRRFCNCVFRRYGGLCEEYIAPGAKKLLMRNVLRALSPALHEYADIRGFGTVEKLVALRCELYQNGISPASLAEASDGMDASDPLREKASELGTIFSAYDKEIASRFADPDGILSRCAEVLAREDFFAGATVFLDSFTSFSAQQYAIIEHMLRGAENVYITLSYLPEDMDDAACGLLADTNRRLRRLANRAGASPPQSISLRGVKRYQNDELAFLGEHLASGAATHAVWQDAPQNITLTRAANAFAEAEAAAIDICRAVRGGVRYRDITVIVRDTASAEGVVDAVLRKYGIPTFLSTRSDISNMPLVAMVFAAFAVAERGFRGADVIAYLKTGLCGISPEDTSLFENYIVKWNLRGKAFTGDDAWTMHPRGYGMAFTEADSEVLNRLSEIRERVILRLMRFAAALRAAETVRERATVLFDFLSGLSVPELLSRRAEDFRGAGDLASAAETVQVWNAFCGALDQLVLSSGSEKTALSEFSQMLHTVLLDTDIGRIPTSVDEVTVVSASQTVPSHPKIVYLLGANEGVFPARVGEDGFFSEHEKESLARAGLEITNRTKRRTFEELFFFTRAAALPSERLYVSFSHYALSGAELRKSVGVKRIEAIFPRLTTQDFERMAKRELVESRAASFEHALAFSGNLGTALRDYFSALPAYAEKLKYADVPLSAENERLSPAAAEELFGARLGTSYSRLEAYIKCQFSYFCRYELKLQDDLPAKFGAVDIGSFVHGVLERVVKWIADGAKGDLAQITEEMTRDYVETALAMPRERLPRRFAHLFAYLQKSIVLFANRLRTEFAASEFLPCDFELTVGEGAAIRPMTLENEEVSVSLRGKIDRIDAFCGGDGKLYLRVVDYKTGDKTFDLRNVKLGLDMQMLLYLFSVWENGKAYYKKDVLPAGVVYAGVKPPQIDCKLGEKELSEEMKLKTSGLFLREETVLRAMEPSLSGEFIPVKEGDLTKEKPNLLGFDAFCALKKEVRDTVLHHATLLRRGHACARPMTVGGKSPCEYCGMKPICRTGMK